MANIEEVTKTILKLKNRIIEVENNSLKLSETDTRQGLINQLFIALGWDFSDFISVKSEVRTKGYNDAVDYAFYSSLKNEKPILLLEAKALNTNINKPKIVKQLCSYLGELGVQWGVISDGDKYVMYNSKAGDSFEDQKFLTLQIKNCDTDDGLPATELAEKFIALLARENLENEGIQNTYEAHMVNSQIEDALMSLLSEPFDTLANAIRREFKEDRVRTNSGLKISTKKILSYLKELSDEEGRLPLNLENEVEEVQNELITAVALNNSEKEVSEKVSKIRKITKIKDLIDEGLVREGDNWKLNNKGEVVWARITGNGELEINGNVYSNPSKAGHSITKKSCNGWHHWYCKNLNGEWVRAKNIRAIYNDKHGITTFRKAA